MVTGSALVLAVCSLTALGALVLAGPLRLPLFAALGEPVRPLHAGSDVFVVPAAVFSTAAFVLCAWTLGGAARRQTRVFRAATAEADRRATAATSVSSTRRDRTPTPCPAGRTASS